MEKVRILITLFKDIKFDHIYREENVEVDTLSKKALRSRKGGYTSTNGRRPPSYIATLFVISLVHGDIFVFLALVDYLWNFFVISTLVLF